VDREKLRAYRSLGINRLSIGVQSFHDDDLKFLTRIHSAADAKRCVRDAFAAGFENVSIDLMFSLPLQPFERWQANLSEALALGPAHLSCYSLIVEPDTPLFHMVQSKQITPLDADRDAERYAYTSEFLTSGGFEQYEVSNYARPGFRCRHNLAYWSHTDYLGLGPSAHSFQSRSRWWNVRDLNVYEETLEKNEFPLGGGEHLDDPQLMEEAIFLGLRSTGIDLAGFRQRFGHDLPSEYADLIGMLKNQGRVVLKGDILRLTGSGYLVCDEICQAFR